MTTTKEKIMKNGNYMLTPNCLKGLDFDEFAVLSYLIDQEHLHKERHRIDKDGFFMCCISSYMAKSFVSIDTPDDKKSQETELRKQKARMETAIKKLKDRGLITKEVRTSWGQKTFIKINYGAIEDLMKKYQLRFNDDIEESEAEYEYY